MFAYELSGCGFETSCSHTPIAWNSELKAFKGMNFICAVSNRLLNGLFATNVYNTLESCW